MRWVLRRGEWPIGLIVQLEAAVVGDPVRRRWWLSPRRILRDRFVAGVGWILLPVLGLAVVAVVALHGTLNSFETSVSRGQHEVVPLLSLQASATAGVGVDVLLRTTTDAPSRYQQQVSAVERGFSANSHYADPDVAGAVTRAHAHYVSATAVISRWSALPVQQQNDSAIAARAEFATDIRQTRQALTPAITRTQKLARMGLVRSEQSFAQSVTLIIAVGLFAILAAVLIAIRLARSVLTPLGQLRTSLARLGGGDLHHRLALDRSDEFGAVATAVNTMAAQLQRQHDDMNHRVTHDHLTGLGNRVMLRDKLLAAAPHTPESGLASALLLIDLDDFKTINDSLGHQVGDQLLCAVAHRLASNIRSTDVAFRLGGDEFAVLLDGVTGWAEAEMTAVHVLAALTQPFALSGRQLRVTASIGVTLPDPVHVPPSASPSVPPSASAVVRITQRDADSGTPHAGGPCVEVLPPASVGGERLLEAADLAMYAAKRGGKNQVRRYEPTMLATVSERMALEAELRSAIHSGQLRVYYQPIVDLSTGCTRGAEALVRWQHPSRGLLGPDAFISLAEQTGIILELTPLVLRTALLQVAQWQHHRVWPEGARMAVNISPRHLQQPGLVQLITQCLDDADLPGHVLTTEITESALLASDGMHGRGILTAIRGLGAHIAIDDFGTGYSNLSRMQEFPLDVLKIDRSFLRPLLDGRPAPLAAAVITLSDTLGLSTVAEGVEIPTQAAWLLDQGCAHGQGYLYDRPLTASDFTYRLTHTNDLTPHETQTIKTPQHTTTQSPKSP